MYPKLPERSHPTTIVSAVVSGQFQGNSYIGFHHLTCVDEKLAEINYLMTRKGL